MRLRAPRAALVAPLLVASLAACAALPSTLPETVQGEGEVTSEDRTSGEFTHLSVNGGIRVEVTQGPTTSVTVSAQANLLPLIETEVEDGQLAVNVTGRGFTTSEPVVLGVQAPVIESVSLSGGANGSLEVTTDTLVLDLSGGAILGASGTVGTLDLTVSSGAQASLGELQVGDATVTASDGAQATLTVSGTLSGDATAGATVTLTQQPAAVEVTTSVGGMVIGP